MGATNLFMNWTNFQLVPINGGNPYSLAEIVDVGLIRQSDQVVWSADACEFAKLILTKGKVRGIRVRTGSVAFAQLVPEDTPFALSIILNDAKNGTGSGALLVQLSPCVLVQNPAQGQFNQFATDELTFAGYSPTAGVVNPDPLSVVQVS